MLANCLHDLAALGPAGLPALMGALFLAGFAGGLTHCSAMCGPFVLAQAAATAPSSLGGGVLRRLSGGMLLPYHLGRGLGYAALGTLAGGAGAVLAQASGLRWVAAFLLLCAALLMLAQASARFSALLPRLALPRLPRFLEARLGGLLAAPGGWGGVRLGLLLSALPCGLLYAALAAAAGAGSALAGGLAMLAFVAGTMPGLIGVALLGRFFGKAIGPSWRVLGGLLFLLNAAVLAGLAVNLLR
ncbi:sulfite exporter TauE/SafE family protein [Sediminicoccus sp. KRV36]|uniref:sulfite exporter TauE/SafE family protein n=1 Tax=Sediminicoccus sp. KRV36 TaxID=3133721 RepID=UPI00200BB92C|nr:sulfite exporter TauE/SafE family protein [Sediminicoccus rosea]UPY37471.1 sulfite exporter TauE/SafE family protein [Sediminicoccus rosea]